VQHVVSSLQSSSASAAGDNAAATRRPSFALEDVLYVQLFVPRMERDFGSANERYKQLFSMSNAPSRACVQLAAPSSHSSAAAPAAVAAAASFPAQEAPLQLDVVACRRPRDVLHVQSVSAWTPACIGPYSQSSSCAPLLWLAGQIGLEPETMLLSPEPRAQAALALRHCAQVLRAQGSAWNRAVSVVLYWQTDFWHSQQSFVRQVVLPMVLRRMRLPSHDSGAGEKVWAKAAKSVVHVVVPSLPRNALLEVQLIAAAPPAPPAPLPLAAMHLPSIASEAATTLPVSCQVHASHAQGSFASIWADLTVDVTGAAPTAADASASPSSAAVDPTSACALLVSRVGDALHSLHSSWRQVLVLRVYLSSSSLSERDVRIGLHRAFQLAAAVAATGAAGGDGVVPALSVVHVSDVELQVVVDKTVASSPASSRTTTLLAAHFIVLSEESTAAAASSSASAAAAAAASS
jgi:enamine deaminase RidA (YjgF/YER057c/UK114 family)